MTGCPNGCARHALGEIGFIGKAPGKYNMYLGAAFDGSRLSKMYRENIGEADILSELRILLSRYAEAGMSCLHCRGRQERFCKHPL